ncbi:universal stress protein [Pleomorphovibrio marinus]|uniref:universal stress protein n=1 Tax=Pleomorphovibrio marinus TaxID=2164132 RepID=UPI000E0A31CF|nr:universal stress protein [Pleomorphovibrio marinus]
MKRRLIIALDFSEYAIKLLEYAQGLASLSDASILLVHQSTVMAPSLADAEIRKDIAKRTNAENLAKLKVMAREANLPESVTKYIVSDEHLHSTLEKLMEEPYDHFLMMGVKGTGVLKQIFLGSNVLTAIQQLSCKILALPKEAKRSLPNKLLVGIHPQFDLNTEQLEKLIAYYGNQINSLVFFSVLKSSDDTEKTVQNLAQISEKFKGSFATKTEIVREMDVKTQTKALMAANPESLLVLQRGSRFFSDLVFRKMLINELIYEGEVAMAVLP